MEYGDGFDEGFDEANRVRKGKENAVSRDVNKPARVGVSEPKGNYVTGDGEILR